MYESSLPVDDGQPLRVDLRGKGNRLGKVGVWAAPDDPDHASSGQRLEEWRKGRWRLGKGGLYGNVLRIAPPMTVTEEEIDTAAEIIADSVSAID